MDENHDLNRDGSITDEVIKRQVDKIVSSPIFTSAPQLARFLQFVVDETLAGRSDRIKQYSVAVNAFGRGSDFNPQLDNIVRIEARRLRRALDKYYQTHGNNDPVHIEIPSGGYVPVFWPRQVTGEPSPHPDVQMISPKPRPKSIQEELSKPLLAVVSLSNLSPDERYAYMSSGLTEEILMVLTKYSEFPIMGPLSRERLERAGLGPREIGARYGVRFVLDGSVRGNSRRIRVGVRLIDTTSGSNVWAETYDRQFDEEALLEIEQEIGQRVLGATADVHGVMQRTLTVDIRDLPPVDLNVHQAILKFYHYLRAISPENYEETLNALENAVKSAPNYGPALAALGGMHVDGHTLFGAPQEYLDRALTLVEKSYRLEQKDYFVRYTRAFVYFYTRDADEFEQAVDLAVRKNPRTVSNGELGVWCTVAGKSDKGLALFELARRANPHHPGYFYYAPFLAHAYQAEFEKALAAARQIEMPTLFLDPIARAVALGHLGRQAEAGAAVAELLQLVPGFAEHGKETIRRIIRYDQPVEILLEGLHKAGLELETEVS